MVWKIVWFCCEFKFTQKAVGRSTNHSQVIQLEHFLQRLSKHLNFGLIVKRELHQEDEISRQCFDNLLGKKHIKIETLPLTPMAHRKN